MSSIKPLKYTRKEWKPIWDQMCLEHGLAINITSFCRKKLGFSVRNHSSWDEELIYIDFYDETSRTLFLMKWTPQCS